MLAQAEVRNLLALLREYGYVPNGARSYYVNRRHVNCGSDFVLPGLSVLRIASAGLHAL